MNNREKSTVFKYLPVIAIFILMCVLRLWFAILSIFTAGFIISLLLRNRFYCGHLCPLGALSDIMASEAAGKLLKVPAYIKAAVVFIFWTYVVFITFAYLRSPGILWLSMLRFSVLIAVAALLLQTFFRHRTWCTALCPMGRVLSLVSNSDAKGPKVDPDKCVSCGKCTAECPLPQEKAPPAGFKVDVRLCLQCEKCVSACLHGAIEIK